MLILLKLQWCFGHGLKTCMWFRYNPQIIFCHIILQFKLSLFSGIYITINLNLVFFQAFILLSTYVDSMYLVRVTSPINFTFSDDSLFLKKILAGDINSLNLLVYNCSWCCAMWWL